MAPFLDSVAGAPFDEVDEVSNATKWLTDQMPMIPRLVLLGEPGAGKVSFSRKHEST